MKIRTSRRKFLQFIGLESWSLLAMKNSVLAAPDEKPDIEFLKNESLATIRDGFRGNPMIDGRFVNANLTTSGAPFSSILKWWSTANPQKEEKDKDNDTYSIPVQTLSALREIKNDCIIWLGHAAFLIRLGGKWILTDPCLTAPPFQKRFTSLPIPIDQVEVDYILLSHGHYDHLDSTTLAELPAKKTRALVPLKMGETILSMNKHLDVVEAGWYQEYSINEKFRIYFLPAQHWYLRVPWDRNKILWGSFMIEYEGKHIYFAGDTAYADHFTEIASLFPSIDYCMLPVGAYKPEYVMKTNHTDPEEAVRAFHELRGRYFLPMHYGTFDLSDEPRGEPVRWLKKLEAEGKIKGHLKIPEIGEIIHV